MKGKKLIAPIVVTAIMILLFGGYFLSGIIFTHELWIRVLVVVTGVALIGVSIFVLVERIKEIRSGEEDDLGKY